jgi:hypothetical protein
MSLLCMGFGFPECCTISNNKSFYLIGTTSVHNIHFPWKVSMDHGFQVNQGYMVKKSIFLRLLWNI